jgi:glycosyltransferase involved in cell wall biosynthesis
LTRDYLNFAGIRGILKNALARAVFHNFRLWDVASAPRVDHFIANSRYTARRIRRFYGRESTVIYPPVDLARFPLQEDKEDFFVTVSRLFPGGEKAAGGGGRTGNGESEGLGSRAD